MPRPLAIALVVVGALLAFLARAVPADVPAVAHTGAIVRIGFQVTELVGRACDFVLADVPERFGVDHLEADPRLEAELRQLLQPGTVVQLTAPARADCVGLAPRQPVPIRSLRVGERALLGGGADLAGLARGALPIAGALALLVGAGLGIAGLRRTRAAPAAPA